MQERIKQEFELLRQFYGGIAFLEEGQWVQLPRYRLPPPWQPPEVPIAFQIPVGYAGAAPYGFFAPADLTCGDAKPNASPPPHPPPFVGAWLQFSWGAQDWRPTADVVSGSNLWGWCRSFSDRFKDGP